jgi:dihydroorotate dehydrogenase
VAGLKFENRVGIAAGMDKNAEYYQALGLLGFGFVEIGTVTPMPQMGNAAPRLFRLPLDAALINRMGFNNQGVDVAAHRLKNRPKNLIIGGNIGKNKDTPNHKAVLDYEKCFERLFNFVDYFVVNVSSPNTPDLRALQEKDALEGILTHLQKINAHKTNPKPIFLKIAPDLTHAQLDDIIDIIHKTNLAGVVATNTTTARPTTLRTPAATVAAMGAGGLSGVPLRTASTEIIQYLRQRLHKNVAIIGVGGIHSAADAQEKIAAGADLVQLYTGFVYQGPILVHNINQQLR